ncbi:hypothetical protein HDU98_004973 [Podochytrium sp. JEL0797]|nr:hypothetical protein HDU98_004973 [Podochytrium sp. JEL0797]
MSPTAATGNVNPSRLRKTAKASGHMQATGLAPPTSADLPKGRRARDKVLESSPASAKVTPLAAGGLDTNTLLTYGFVSIVFWLGIVGWFFGVNLNMLVFRVVTFPIRFPFRMVYRGVDWISTGFATMLSGDPHALTQAASKVMLPVGEMLDDFEVDDLF